MSEKSGPSPSVSRSFAVGESPFRTARRVLESIDNIGRMLERLSSGLSAPGRLSGRSLAGLLGGENPAYRPARLDLFGGSDLGQAATSSFDRIEKRYRDWLETARGGNLELFGSFARLFEMIAERSGRAFEAAGGGFAIMQEKLYPGLAEYAGGLSALTGAAGRAFQALRAMNPIAAMIASSALSLLGSFFNRRQAAAAPASSVMAYAGSGTASVGASAAGGWTGPQVVNVYIDGIRVGGEYEMDRTLGRAGVDRQLRDRIRELVRTGANPAGSR
ncbi:MAG: hypothetical protein V1794_11945 [Candidatus Glassbacteria bacterium]